mmetsp:Transcript_48189/g.102941  ORF Transcript_48189/g.102941 Transcript_48189/m.102941 type:complete len:81 (-) Transcript_48189:5-247(-)|eukprot:CAMPEP_0183342696 /NCGR_PEP_ID=MMETSP0164_2-20130417/8762_1 /TAXON_ID=221442 /ORGANISM="Coccolithus pelagicus ssp braarudi, Strain PLY182g" /LENGTH=80 /DNA_ID=CAMNT_0025513361 /DNA_START=91 /DNA_END=333 /DNA_ORIENTATION=-
MADDAVMFDEAEDEVGDLHEDVDAADAVEDQFANEDMEQTGLRCGACKVGLTDMSGKPVTTVTFAGHSCRQCKRLRVGAE